MKKPPQNVKSEPEKVTKTFDPNAIRIPTGEILLSDEDTDPITSPIAMRKIVPCRRYVHKSQHINYIQLPIPTYLSVARKSNKKRRKGVPAKNVASPAEIDIELFQEMRCNAEVDYESCVMDITSCGHVVTAMEHMYVRDHLAANLFYGRLLC